MYMHICAHNVIVTLFKMASSQRTVQMHKIQDNIITL